jgi:hypothetical protein
MDRDEPLSASLASTARDPPLRSCTGSLNNSLGKLQPVMYVLKRAE